MGGVHESEVIADRTKLSYAVYPDHWNNKYALLPDLVTQIHTPLEFFCTVNPENRLIFDLYPIFME
jgi:hypothetical protein